VTARLRGSRHGQVAVLMVGAVAARRSDDDRRGPSLAKQVRTSFDSRDIGQTPRSKLKLAKGLAVGAQRELIVNPGCHITKMGGRNVLSGGQLEIKHVNRLRGILDQILR